MNVQEVVGQVAARFGAMAGELLEQLQKTETSLKRLKKARAPEAAPDAGAAGAQMSDIDKMARQLFLDVQVCPSAVRLSLRVCWLSWWCWCGSDVCAAAV